MKSALVLLGLLFIANAYSATEVVEYRCGVNGTGSVPEGIRSTVVRVLNLGESEPLRLPDGADPTKHSLSCARSLLVPSVNDAKVLAAGFKLFIGSEGKGPNELRMGILVGSQPNVDFAIIDGKQTKAEERLTRKVLKAINGK